MPILDRAAESGYPLKAALDILPKDVANHGGSSGMQILVSVILTWLSFNFGLPAIDQRPRIELVPWAKMAELRYSRVASKDLGRTAAKVQESPPKSFDAAYAMYDDASQTVYLPREWAADSPADVSMLVHELVHHVQNVSRLKYACAQARERLAYRAQARWLKLFHKTLADEFGISAMTLLVRTHCMG